VRPAAQRLAAALARLGLLAGVAAVQGCKSTQNKYQHTFHCHISQRSHFELLRDSADMHMQTTRSRNSNALGGCDLFFSSCCTIKHQRTSMHGAHLLTRVLMLMKGAAAGAAAGAEAPGRAEVGLPPPLPLPPAPTSAERAADA